MDLTVSDGQADAGVVDDWSERLLLGLAINAFQ